MVIYDCRVARPLAVGKQLRETKSDTTVPTEEDNLTPDDDFEARLRQQLADLESPDDGEDENDAPSEDDDASKADKPEGNDDKPEEEADSDETDTSDADEKDEADADEPEESEPSKDDDVDEKLPSGTRKVPVQRLTQVNRKLRKTERENRELKEQLEALQANAAVDGIDLDYSKIRITKENLAEIADQTSRETALTLYKMQQRQDELDAQESDDGEMSNLRAALESNDDTAGWQLLADDGDTSDWLKFKETWNQIGDKELERKFKTWDERVEHVVRQTKKAEEAKSKKEKALKKVEKQEKDPEDKPKRRSLNNVSGGAEKAGDEVDEVMAMDNPTAYLLQLERSPKASDRKKYERLRAGMRTRTLEARRNLRS